MSTPSIVHGTKMNVGAIFVFCCAIIFQGSNAAPAPLEVTASAGNPLIQNAAAGDVLLKTPEPLHPLTSADLGSATDTLATALNDSIDSVQVGDHTLGTSTSTVLPPTGNTSASLPTSFSPGAFATSGSSGAFAPSGSPGTFATSGSPGAFATSGFPGGLATSGLPGGLATSGMPGVAVASGAPGAFAAAAGSPGMSTIETATSPLDTDLSTTTGSAATTGSAVADPLMFYRILTNLLRQSEQFMQSMYAPPFPGMGPPGFPSLRLPGFRSQIMPNIGMGVNDPSLKLVDQKIIDDGTVKGQFSTYQGQPDPHTVTKMQTGQFSVNNEGMQGAGVGHYYSSSSASNSLGGNPMASVGTFFSGLPSRFNMAFPLRMT